MLFEITIFKPLYYFNIFFLERIQLMMDSLVQLTINLWIVEYNITIAER